MINTTSESLKARNFFICRYLGFYEQLKFRAQLSMKKVIPWGLVANPLDRYRGYNFLLLNSTEHELCTAHKT